MPRSRRSSTPTASHSVGAARFFINGLDTTTRGVDVVAAYTFNAGSMGGWTLTGAYNCNKTKIDKRLNTLGPLAQIPGLVLFGRVEGIRFTHGQPRDKIVFSADGDIGAFGVTARTTRYGKVVSPGAAAPVADPLSLTAFGPDDIFLGAKWITDLEGRVEAAGQDRAGARREQSVRRLSGPLAVRPAGRPAASIRRTRSISLTRSSRRSASTAAISTAGWRSTSDRVARWPGTRLGLVAVLGAQLVPPFVEAVEHGRDRRMVDRLVGLVGDEVLLADVGDVALLRILGEQVVEGLVLGRAHRFGDRLVPFLAIGELGIDVEDDAAEVEQPVAHDFADAVAGQGDAGLELKVIGAERSMWDMAAI